MVVRTGRAAQRKRGRSLDSAPRVVVEISDGQDLNHEIRRGDREMASLSQERGSSVLFDADRGHRDPTPR